MDDIMVKSKRRVEHFHVLKSKRRVEHFHVLRKLFEEM